MKRHISETKAGKDDGQGAKRRKEDLWSDGIIPYVIGPSLSKCFTINATCDKSGRKAAALEASSSSPYYSFTFFFFFLFFYFIFYFCIALLQCYVTREVFKKFLNILYFQAYGKARVGQSDSIWPHAYEKFSLNRNLTKSPNIHSHSINIVKKANK